MHRRQLPSRTNEDAPYRQRGQGILLPTIVPAFAGTARKTTTLSHDAAIARAIERSGPGGRQPITVEPERRIPATAHARGLLAKMPLERVFHPGQHGAVGRKAWLVNPD